MADWGDIVDVLNVKRTILLLDNRGMGDSRDENNPDQGFITNIYIYIYIYRYIINNNAGRGKQKNVSFVCKGLLVFIILLMF